MLDSIPMATLLSVAAVVVVVIAYVSNDISVDQALIALGVATGGAGILGHARNGAGRGLK